MVIQSMIYQKKYKIANKPQQNYNKFENSMYLIIQNFENVNLFSFNMCYHQEQFTLNAFWK